MSVRGGGRWHSEGIRLVNVHYESVMEYLAALEVPWIWSLEKLQHFPGHVHQYWLCL